MVRSVVCPGCGAKMVFDAGTQKMKCEYCETILDVTSLIKSEQEASAEAKSNILVDGDFQAQQKTGDFKVFHCASCGAELLTDDYTSATFCSFCGQPSMIEERLSGQVLPSYVIPFQIGKEQAQEIFKNWAKKGIFTPRTLKKDTTIQKVTGIYVPFWLYDYDAKMDCQADCIKVRHSSDSKYNYTYTDHYSVERYVTASYNRIPCDASIKMPDDTMDLLEPFNYNKLQKFNMAYLSGFYAEKFNYTAEDLTKRVEKRVTQYIEKNTLDTISGYTSVHIRNKNIYLNPQKAEYALLPVWLLSYRLGDKNYMFTLNGQTGKMVAKRPVSIKRVLYILCITYIIIGLVCLLIVMC